MIGNPVDAGGLNARLGDTAVGLRDACFSARELWSFVVSLGADQAGQTAGLVTLGFSSPDAAAYWTKANNAFAVAQLYFGLISQASPFDYDSALAGVRGASR